MHPFLRSCLAFTAVLGVALGASADADAKRKKKKPAPKKGAPAKVKRVPVDPGPVYKVPVDLKRDAYKGNPDALVTWVVFCDLQDPFCDRFRFSIGKAREYFGADLRVVFKHRPMSWHRQAYRNGEAAQCALEHDLFWEFHDYLVMRRSRSSQKASRVLENARAAGIAGKALETFERCFTSRKYDKHIADDMALAEKVGARGVPYSYVNGRLVRGAVRYDTIREIIERELTAARALARKKKLADGEVYAAIIAKGQYYSRLAKKAAKFPKKGAAVRPATKKKAKHVLTTFVDLRSSWSNRVTGALLKLQKEHPEEITLNAWHYPMGRRGYAQLAQRAGACAQTQGRFWAFVEALLASPNSTAPRSNSDWRGLAKKAGVASIPGFDLCLTGGGTDDKVKADIAVARQVRTSSGSIFVNGKRWGGSAKQLKAYLYPDAADVNDSAPSKRLAEKKAKCASKPKMCLFYAWALERFGEPGKRWVERAKALERGCKADDYKACRALAKTYRDGNGVPFDPARVKTLKAQVCKLSNGKYDCPPKPKKKKHDPRYDFFNPNVARN